MATTPDATVTVYDIATNTPVYQLPHNLAHRDLAYYRSQGATVHEYDTTDRTGTPLHIAITIDAPRPGHTPDQGAVFEFATTPTTPTDLPNPPTPTGHYAAVLALYRAKGAAHAPNDALMAGLCHDTLQTLVGAVSPQLVWEGAMKKHLTAKELLHLCHTDIFAVDDLQWI